MDDDKIIMVTQNGKMEERCSIDSILDFYWSHNKFVVICRSDPFFRYVDSVSALKIYKERPNIDMSDETRKKIEELLVKEKTIDRFYDWMNN